MRRIERTDPASFIKLAQEVAKLLLLCRGNQCVAKVGRGLKAPAKEENHPQTGDTGCKRYNQQAGLDQRYRRSRYDLRLSWRVRLRRLSWRICLRNCGLHAHGDQERKSSTADDPHDLPSCLLSGIWSVKRG